MGLYFTVGTTFNAFMQPFADQIHEEIEKRLGYSVPKSTSFGEGGFQSEELGWSGWQKLQARAVAVLGEGNVPHLLAMEAWQGVYLPIPIDPVEIEMPGTDTPLQCGCLIELVKELERFAGMENLPVDQEQIQGLWVKYMDDDDLVDADMDIQTYIQLTLSAKIATAQKLPLWVVK